MFLSGHKSFTLQILLQGCCNSAQGLGDFCVEPNDALEDMASNYVEKGEFMMLTTCFDCGKV